MTAPLVFALADGTQEIVWPDSPRFRELIADGFTPVGSVPESDGISDKLKTYLTGLVDGQTGPAQDAADAATAAASAASTASAAATAAVASVQRETAGGVAGLDGSGKIIPSRVPDLSATYVPVAGLDAATTTMRGGSSASALNAFLSAASPLGVKKLVGAFTVGAVVAIPANTYVDATAATLTTTVSTSKAVTVAAGATLWGGSITSPASWDGTNTGGPWTAAVVSIEGDGATVERVTLTNVPRVGIGINNGDDAIIRGNRITGNYPSAQYTGVETNHFGIAVEPGPGAGGGHVIQGNNVKSCVQGVWIGPLDGGQGSAKTIAVSGNSFWGCHNHGVYGYGAAIAVTGNVFHRCQTSVALSGSYHVCSSNAIYTEVVTGTDGRDLTGISIRDAIGCVVSDNTIRGIGSTGGVIIDVRAETGTVCRDNVVADNIIDVAGGTSTGIRIGAGATTCTDNTVHDNHVRAIGVVNLGCITVAPSATGYGNSVHDNTVVMIGNSHGIFLSNNDGTRVHHNMVRLEFDSPSAVTLGMVALVNSTRCRVDHNEFRTIAAFGTNVSIRCVYELSATVTACRYEDNDYVLDTTKAAATALVLQAGGAFLDERLPGVPGLAAAVGSTWRRTDGGTTSTLYVKETGTGSTGWVAK